MASMKPTAQCRQYFLAGAKVQSVCPVRKLLFLLLPACLAAQGNDWKIVPGVRVGPITGESTLDSLKRQFGAANVRQEMLADEIHEYQGTVIYPDTPARRLEITWDDSGHHPSEIHIGSLEGIGPGTWKTAEGIAIGTSLLQLEKLNGHAFHLAGFAWDYSGTVTSWDGGRLAPLKAAVWSSASIRDRSSNRHWRANSTSRS
jgi:hypothetical protein